jgi:riboflavin kinase / FMN adenylyltransferase
MTQARIAYWAPDFEYMGRAVVAIGVFDGVHIGHQELLKDAVTNARTRGVPAVAVTFDRDPDQVVSPITAAAQLLTLEDKLEAIGKTGIDTVLVVPFTREISKLTPEEFLDDVLLRALKPAAVHVGYDFRFGNRAAGTVETLERYGVAHGFQVLAHELVKLNGEAVTSTRVRSRVAAGRIAEATELLGKHPCVAGTVHEGRGEGAGLGFPTANIVPDEFSAMPPDGVYAGKVRLPGGSEWAAAISVGRPPMYPDASDTLEAHLIGFTGSLYGRKIRVEFWERLRDQTTFASAEELAAAIADDVDYAGRITGVAATGYRLD